MRRILVMATRNAGKVDEIRRLLDGMDLDVRSLADFPGVPEVVEDGETFRDNALKKALTVSAATGCLALADDSGLEVDALGGAPGVRSARFAGEAASDAENNAKLLELLAGLPEERRTARFRCVLVLADPSGRRVFAQGACEGRITVKPAGTGGFGYDPVFFVPALGRTMAELEPAEKNRISHRGEALRRLIEVLPEFVKDCVAKTSKSDPAQKTRDARREIFQE